MAKVLKLHPGAKALRRRRLVLLPPGARRRTIEDIKKRASPVLPVVSEGPQALGAITPQSSRGLP